MSIAITTPTGHIGSQIVRHLLAAGEDLVLLLRDPDKLPADVRGRTETKAGELQDADYVREAAKGVDALFWLSPNDWTMPSIRGWYDQLGRSAAGAVAANGIGHVVHLSSEGAEHREGLGPVSGLGRIEDALDATGAAVRHLRPTFFFENFEAQLGAIHNAGAVFFPASPTTSTSMIATRDIAAAAAELLQDRSWTGQEAVVLYGPHRYTYAEAAEVLSEGLGRKVRAQQVPPEALVEQFKGMGASDDYAEGLVELYARIGHPDYYSNAQHARTTSTQLDSYVADTLKPMFEAMG